MQLVLTQGSECFSEAGVEKKDAVKRGKYFPVES